MISPIPPDWEAGMTQTSRCTSRIEPGGHTCDAPVVVPDPLVPGVLPVASAVQASAELTLDCAIQISANGLEPASLMTLMCTAFCSMPFAVLSCSLSLTHTSALSGEDRKSVV